MDGMIWDGLLRCSVRCNGMRCTVWKGWVICCGIGCSLVRCGWRSGNMLVRLVKDRSGCIDDIVIGDIWLEEI